MGGRTFGGGASGGLDAVGQDEPAGHLAVDVAARQPERHVGHADPLRLLERRQRLLRPHLPHHSFIHSLFVDCWPMSTLIGSSAALGNTIDSRRHLLIDF